MPRTSHHGFDDADMPLTELCRPGSPTSSTASDFDHLLADDVSNTSSSDLPPVDWGRGAWMCLLGCWLVEAPGWGFPLAFGIFQSYYSDDDLFKNSTAIPTIGALATGVAYLGMPLANVLCIHWERHRKLICVAGWLLCLLSLLGASLASQVWHLLLSQGLLYGTGWVLCYTPILFMLNEWFVERRGLAYGILFGASGISGLIIPAAVGALLQSFGFRVALRVYVAATIVISGPALLLIKPRLKPKDTPAHGEKMQGFRRLLPFVGNIHFATLGVAVFAQGLGFFIPNIFLPSFAEALGLSSDASSGILAAISLSMVAGQILLGWISDRVNIYIPVSLTAGISGLSSLLLWGLAKDLTFLVPFSLLWGFNSASYSVLYTRICTFLTAGQDGDGNADEAVFMWLYGFFSFERGVANILEGPVTSWLLSSEREVDVKAYGLGKYASVVWFTTLCMLSSSACGIVYFWARQRDWRR